MMFARDEFLTLREDDAVWHEVGDEVIVLELTTTTYLTLNGTGKRIWLQLVSGATVGQLVDVLVQEYQIGVERAAADVEAFLSTLSDRNLIGHPS